MRLIVQRTCTRRVILRLYPNKLDVAEGRGEGGPGGEGSDGRSGGGEPPDPGAEPLLRGFSAAVAVQ